MKTTNKLLTALLLAGLNTATIAEEKEIKVMVEDIHGITSKTITVNGKQLDAEGIAQLEADGNVKIIRLDGLDAEIGDVMTLAKLGGAGINADNIEISINTDDGVVTKTVIMNGKELNEAEIADLESQGKLKSISIDGGSMQQVMFIDTDGINDVNIPFQMETHTSVMHIEDDAATLGFMTNIKKDGWHVISVSKDSGAQDAGLKAGDIIKFMGDMDLSNNSDTVFEQLKQKPNHEEGEMVDLEVERNGKLIYMSVEARKNDSFDMAMSKTGSNDYTFTNQIFPEQVSPGLGFMTMKHKDGVHVGYIYDGSGAQGAGLQANDVIKMIGDIDFSYKDGEKGHDLGDLPDMEVGEFIQMKVERDGVPMEFSIEVTEYNKSMPHLQNPEKFYDWLRSVKDHSENLDKQMKVMVMSSDSIGKSIDFNDLDINLPDMLGNMNVFITDGNSTSKLLGAKHEMSALSAGLSSYFGTSGGVLMMHIIKNNVFGLEDGDVIKSIDGIDVKSPKDVIKQLLKAEKQENISLEIVRHKRNKTLKYNK